MKKEFWKDWKRKTKLEEAAIVSLKKALNILLKNLPKKEIVAIYVKGSFVRREMTKKSDVDTVTILKESKYLKNLRKLEEKYRSKYYPQIEFSGYSIWELKHNKRAASGKKVRASPSRAVQHLDNYKLLYGKQLRKEDFASGTDIGHLKSMIKVFHNLFLPGLKEKKFGFSDIIKQVFWLIENEQRVRGNNAEHSFKKLVKSIKDKDHIVHDAYRLRLKPTKDKKIRAQFISKLKRYLKELENMLKYKEEHGIK